MNIPGQQQRSLQGISPRIAANEINQHLTQLKTLSIINTVGSIILAAAAIYGSLVAAIFAAILIVINMIYLVQARNKSNYLIQKYGLQSGFQLFGQQRQGQTYGQQIQQPMYKQRQNYNQQTPPQPPPYQGV